MLITGLKCRYLRAVSDAQAEVTVSNPWPAILTDETESVPAYQAREIRRRGWGLDSYRVVICDSA